MQLTDCFFSFVQCTLEDIAFIGFYGFAKIQFPEKRKSSVYLSCHGNRTDHLQQENSHEKAWLIQSLGNIDPSVVESIHSSVTSLFQHC